jgi:hypothetical protein
MINSKIDTINILNYPKKEILTKDVIYKCYIECIKFASNNLGLFTGENGKIKKNHALIINNIRDAIKKGIRKSIPIENILK